MVVIRATRKVLRSLAESADEIDMSETALGDWYVNRVVVNRQPLLLFVSSKSLLPMLEPARNVKTVPERFPSLVAARLRRLNVDPDLVDFELIAMNMVRVARTRDRSVLGTMVDFAHALSYYLPVTGWDDRDLRLAEGQLARTPCRAGRAAHLVIFPDRDTPRLLEERWRPATTAR